MKKLRVLIRIFLFICLFSILTPPTFFVNAENSPTITATGSYGESTLTFIFPPLGGKVTGSLDYLAPNSDSRNYCSFSYHIVFEGSFSGGDGGSASGTEAGSLWGECRGDQVVNSNYSFEYSGTWSGNFFANGTGSGIFEMTGPEAGPKFEGQQPWQVTFSPEDFKGALKPPVTSEYIFNTYGIRVEDNFGDTQYVAKAWSDHELSLLNDVLKELPPGFIKHLSLNKIVRKAVAFDENGNQKPGRFGEYISCNHTIDPTCNGSSTVINVYDGALQSTAEFPDSDMNFKALLLHEITHAAEYYIDKDYTYKNTDNFPDAYQTPLMQNFMDATRPDTSINGGITANGWGYYGRQGWKCFGTQGNNPPTNYGGKNPKEDLSESVKLYVYDPQKLKNSSMQRYNFVRNQLFGGIEYENGTQKTP